MQLSLPFTHLFLMGLTCGTGFANPIPELDQALDKRANCAQFNPGGLVLSPSASPFLVCGAISFIFQEDGNFVAYHVTKKATTAVWNSTTYGHTCGTNNCTLEFQYDGNFVEYYNRSPIWYTGTGANIGKQLWFANTAPYLYVLNSAGAKAWKS